MQKKLVVALIGRILIVVGGSMVVPLFVALYFGEAAAWAFFATLCLTMGSGVVLILAFPIKQDLRMMDGFSFVTYGWIAASLLGALPFYWSGVLPSYIDAVFETVSGFTTTGATVFVEIESLPRCILLWRSLTHWLGGMGIIVLFIALVTGTGSGGLQLYKAETSGPIKEKIKPRISQVAKHLWLIYLVLTLVNALALYLAGMNVFDAVNHAMATIATGGFSTKNSSIAYFDSPMIEWVSIIFMALAGVSFSIYYFVYAERSWRPFVYNQKNRVYFAVIGIAAALIYLANFLIQPHTLYVGLRTGLFQVVSIITTTGFVTSDFDLWPTFSQGIILCLLFVGACAGSTTGGIKIDRWMIILKQVKYELLRIVHPRVVTRLKIENQPISDRTIITAGTFIFLYFAIVALGTVFSAAFGLNFIESLSTTATCLGNCGPAFLRFGPIESFAELPAFLKVQNSFLMLLGRLEIYTVLVVLLPIRNK